jgi:3-deoxy-D-arabino-heptulosonate 7-phosphate (DAHP) synthase
METDIDERISLRHRFRDVIMSEEELRAVVGPASERSVAKVVRVVDEYARRFMLMRPSYSWRQLLTMECSTSHPRAIPLGS